MLLIYFIRKSLQERKVGVVSFIARHGHYFVDWVFDAIDLATKEHEVVYL